MDQPNSASTHRSARLHRERLLWVAVLSCAAALRLIGLDRFPQPVEQDELSNIYDGWSIAETGADRAGRQWPILCYGNGPRDYRPALMAWLCAGAYEVFGFSVAGCRSISAAIGVLTVFLAGIWARRFLGPGAGLLVMTFLAFSPWHVMLSRTAHEGGALPGLFCVLIVWLIQRAAADDPANTPTPKRTWTAQMRWAAAGLAIGLSTNAYGATRLSAAIYSLLALATLLAATRRKPKSTRRRLVCTTALVTSIAIGAAPQIWEFLQQPQAFLGRAQAVAFDARGPADAVWTFTLNFSRNLDPRYLFLSFGYAHRMVVGRLSFIGLPFLYLAVICLAWPKTRWSPALRIVLLGGLLANIAPAAVTKTNPHALRASGNAVLLPMLVTLGVMQACTWLRILLARGRSPGNENQSTPHPRAAAIAAVCVTLTGFTYVIRYLNDPALHALGTQPEWVAIGESLRDRAARYDRIYIEPFGNSWHLYVAAFAPIPPREFQQTTREFWGKYTDFYVRLGKYHFKPPSTAFHDWQQADHDECWLVIAPRDDYEAELGCGSDRPPSTAAYSR